MPMSFCTVFVISYLNACRLDVMNKSITVILVFRLWEITRVDRSVSYVRCCPAVSCFQTILELRWSWCDDLKHDCHLGGSCLTEHTRRKICLLCSVCDCNAASGSSCGNNQVKLIKSPKNTRYACLVTPALRIQVHFKLKKNMLYHRKLPTLTS